jgi:putative effector of murein hydrolase
VAKSEVSPDEAVRRAWIVIGASAYLGSATIGGPLFGKLAQISTTIGSLALAMTLPQNAKRVFHPIVVCATLSNFGCRFVGTQAVPYFDNGNGIGDMFFKWLPAAVAGLGVRMYDTTGKWLDNPEDFRCVLTTCACSGVFSVVFSSLAAVSTRSPLSVPAPLSLPLLHRSVMSALGIEGSKAVGPECDPKLAVASILITGCIGASLGNSLLEALPGMNTASPLVRGVSMGCSAHSIGTAGLISNADTDAAAISGASMCLAGTMHTLVINLPGVVPTIRAMAGLS